jgi:hypothetical protein
MSESDQQVAVIQWWRLKYPKLKSLLITSQSGVIVGGKSKFAIIAKQKKEGWLPGVPDIFIAVPRGGYHGLWLELKDSGKTKSSLSKDQIQYLSDLGEQGYSAVWCAGSAQAIEIIEHYMSLNICITEKLD